MMRMSDSSKTRMILLSTTMLPVSLRVAVRERLLTQFELGKARRANLIIIGHPKSGNTWLRTMLSRLYQVRYGLPEARYIKTDELARRHPAIPRLAATNGYYSYEGIIGKVLDVNAPDSELCHKPKLLLARNPCDIAVSWYFQFTKRQSASKQELINHFIEHPIDRHTISMWDFVRHSDIGLPFLIEYLNTWERNLSRLERSLVVRYEDLRTQPAAILKQIVQLMDEPCSDAEIREAVEFCSFENLRKLESAGFFRQWGLNLRNPKDVDSFKVRRGKVNGYHDYFSPEQVAELEDLMYSRLSPTFGYHHTNPKQPETV